MEFEKMKRLSYDEYVAETKSRQKLSALRTASIRDKEKNKNQLLEAKQNYIIKLQQKKELEVQNAIIELQNQNLKVSVSSIICWSSTSQLCPMFILAVRLEQRFAPTLST